MENNRAEIGFIEKGKLFLKALAVALSICGIMTIAPATEGMQAQGISGENSQIIEFVDDLQKSLPGLNRLPECKSIGENGNILFYKNGNNIIMLTSGGYSPQNKRQECLKKLKFRNLRSTKFYALSAIDIVFLCDPKVTLKRYAKEQLENGAHYRRPQWENIDSPDGSISPKLAEKILPSLIKYLKLVTENVTPDALLERIKTERKDYDINFGPLELWDFCFEVVFRNLLKETDEEQQEPLTDKILFDLIRGNLKSNIKDDKILLEYASDEKISVPKSEKIINFISLLRGGGKKTDNSAIASDVAIGRKVISKLSSISKSDLKVLLEYAFNGKGDGGNADINKGWLKRALHTEVQCAVLKALAEDKKMHPSVSLKFFAPKNNIVYSLLDPCISCARTPLILNCRWNGLRFLYSEADNDGDKNELYHAIRADFLLKKLNITMTSAEKDAIKIKNTKDERERELRRVIKNKLQDKKIGFEDFGQKTYQKLLSEIKEIQKQFNSFGGQENKKGILEDIKMLNNKYEDICCGLINEEFDTYKQKLFPSFLTIFSSKSEQIKDEINRNDQLSNDIKEKLKKTLENPLYSERKKKAQLKCVKEEILRLLTDTENRLSLKRKSYTKKKREERLNMDKLSSECEHPSLIGIWKGKLK